MTMRRSRLVIFALSIMLFTQGCFFARGQAQQPLNDEPQTTETVVYDQSSIVTEALLSTATPVPTATQGLPTLTATPSVRITAIDGNLYIRRGPDTAYNRIGILKNAATADVIGQDMLSKWVQIQIPGTELTGWVSLLTPYSRIDGDLKNVPAFTFTEWPEPAYIKNCTEHDLIILPNELYLYSLWRNPQYLNVVQVDPGVYQIQDATLPDAPVYDMVDVQEGETIYVTVNGLGEYHKCPENN